MARLGINIDLMGKLRHMKGSTSPDPVEIALCAQRAGAHKINVSLTEKRTYIFDYDILRLKQNLSIPLNLKIPPHKEMIDFALEIKPDMVTFVAEKEEESFETLPLLKCKDDLFPMVGKLTSHGIPVSLFLEPSVEDIKISKDLGAQIIELHTGDYAEESEEDIKEERFKVIEACAHYAHNLGFIVHAGEGLNYENIKPLLTISHIKDFNVGHSLISYALIVGFERATKEMLYLLK
jgi:pyridoxine 5-phosphate synthase